MSQAALPGHTRHSTTFIRGVATLAMALGTATAAAAARVVVLPGDPEWFAFGGPTSSAAITGANPGPGGSGSLELTQNGNGAGFGREIPVPGLGRFGDLDVLRYDWFIDPASVAFQPRPPEIALRVYAFGDSRSFFLRWKGCDAIDGCPVHPLGSWHTTNVIGRLEIDAAEGPPPASLDDIPPDAPIVGFTVRSNFGQPWHGFADNVTIGFGGHEPTTFDFEIPPPRGVPPVVVPPGDSGWFAYGGPTSSAAITGANPGPGGFGSLELIQSGNGAGFVHEIALPGLGPFGDLDVLNYDWFTDPASVAFQPRPPEIALRVYPFGDSRSFFLRWNGCDAIDGCPAYPLGSWQTTNLIGRLSIQAAEGNIPPASLDDIPPDAPIVGITVRTSFGQPWHGFADNVTIGFRGHAPTTFDFEIPPPRGVPPVVVLPGDPDWYSYFDGSSTSAVISGANPGSAFGSLELTREQGPNSFAAFAREFPLPGLGTFGTLAVLNFDWFIDPASGRAVPPSLAVRVYTYDDPRSFFLAWSACPPNAPCPGRPVGSWQTTNAIGHLSIEPASGNPPPASLADIPPDAPITGIRILTPYQDGLAWHGFVDNVTVGFAGHAPVTYDFEVPPPRGVPMVVVRAGDSDWYRNSPPGSRVRITSTNPRSGRGSLELTKAAGSSVAFGREQGLPGYGRFGDLDVLNYDWFIDPTSGRLRPPDFLLRVYPYGDPRSFFLHWESCPDVPCPDHAAGSWQTTNLIGRLSIQPDGDNTPPVSLEAIPPDAPIVGLHVWSNWADGLAWHAFVDNLTIGFAGHAPVTYNFETPRRHPRPGISYSATP